MAEPRPAQDEADEAAAALPKNAEDRRAAAAMSSLETRGSADDSPAPTQSVDQERLGKAMASLGETKVASGAQTKPEVKKKVKVEKKDVDLLVDELLLSKTQATKLLTKHDGDAEKAAIAYVRGEDTIV